MNWLDDGYNEWLESLKPGDKVAYNVGRQSKRFITTRVKSKTKGGNIRTENNILFRKGIYRIDSWTYYNLESVTQEVLDYVKRVRLLEKIQKTKFETLSTLKLEEIANII